MPTSTTNYSLQKPLVNSATDQDLWGDELNSDLDSLDILLRVGITNTPSVQTTGFTAAVSISAKNLYLCDATAAAFAATLPTASSAGAGATVFFKKTDVSANTVTVTRASSDTIDGATTFVLSARYDWVGLVSDGISAWEKISSTGVPLNSPAFTGTPTAPTAAAGTNTTQIATTKFLFDNFTTTLGATGSVKIPGGLIIKWGTTSLTPHQTTAVTFGTAFTTSCDFAIAGAVNNAAATYPVAIVSFNSTTVTVYNSDGGQTQSASWIAIGQ